MNPGQTMFYNFFLERTKEEHKEEAKAFLEQSFKRQKEGTFDMGYLNELMPKLFAIVKPEAIDDVKKAMEHFSSTL